MKAVIVRAIADLIKEKFGKDNWNKVLEMSGFPPGYYFLVSQNIDDEKVMVILGSICKVLDVSLETVIDLFGIYWVNTFTPKFYKDFFKRFTSAKDMLLKMNTTHSIIMQNTPNAHPPLIDYEWKDDNTLIMIYKSDRGLIDLFIALIKGVGVYFKENLEVTKLDDKRVEVYFPN